MSLPRDCIERKENNYCTYCKKYGHVIEECYGKKKYGKECTYCHKKNHKEKVFWKKQKYDADKEKEKDNVPEEIYYDELFFGDDAPA